MENPTLTFLNPSIFVGDPRKTIIHEIAHSWFGNTMSCMNWGNTWINEGQTTFVEKKISRKISGDDYADAVQF